MNEDIKNIDIGFVTFEQCKEFNDEELEFLKITASTELAVIKSELLLMESRTPDTNTAKIRVRIFHVQKGYDIISFFVRRNNSNRQEREAKNKNIRNSMRDMEAKIRKQRKIMDLCKSLVRASDEITLNLVDEIKKEVGKL